MTALSAAPPLEPPLMGVGHRSTSFVDDNRESRMLAVDVWYPASTSGGPRVSYEILPGISFEAATAVQDAPVATGTYPLLVFSHGRTGMRFNYTLMCEALAARGAVVVSVDHPGDVLLDWLGGTFVDDRTNEINRVSDCRFVIDVMLGTSRRPSTDIASIRGAVDAGRIAVIGHSYGAYTGLAGAAGVRGMPVDDRVRAVVGLQPYTRSMSDAALQRVATPTLLVLSEFDMTAPPETDGERPWRLIPARPLWRFDLGRASHHASSDMGLYLELVGQVPDLPPLVTGYMAMMAEGFVGPRFRPWREGLLAQLRVIWAFFDIVLDIDPARGETIIAGLTDVAAVTLERR